MLREVAKNQFFVGRPVTIGIGIGLTDFLVNAIGPPVDLNAPVQHVAEADSLIGRELQHIETLVVIGTAMLGEMKHGGGDIRDSGEMEKTIVETEVIDVAMVLGANESGEMVAAGELTTEGAIGLEVSYNNLVGMSDNGHITHKGLLAGRQRTVGAIHDKDKKSLLIDMTSERINLGFDFGMRKGHPDEGDASLEQDIGNLTFERTLKATNDASAHRKATGPLENDLVVLDGNLAGAEEGRPCLMEQPAIAKLVKYFHNRTLSFCLPKGHRRP